MNVVVMIQGREAIPVRAIPLVTNWRFMSPDIVSHVLGGTGGSRVSVFGSLNSYFMENGQILPMTEDWWEQFPLNKLRALAKKIKKSEPIDEAGYSTWQELSVKELPAGVFVWKDDYEKLHHANWNNRFNITYCALKNWNGEEPDEDKDVETLKKPDSAGNLRSDFLMDDSLLKRDLMEFLKVLERWREPDYCPFMGAELSATVRDGFAPQQPNTAPVQTRYASDGVKSGNVDWRNIVRAEAYEQWVKTLAENGSPTLENVARHLSVWCVTNEINGNLGKPPMASYIKTHVIGSKYWQPPRNMSREAAKKHLEQKKQEKQAN